MGATIRDVADLAGVSFQLVSAVLAGKKYARASEPTRKRIFDAAEELGYTPSISARILKGGESKVLGVLIDSHAPESLHTLLGELERQADLLGYRLMVAQAHDNPEKLLESCRALKQYGVDGIISFAHHYPYQGVELEEKLRGEKNLVFVMGTGNAEHCTVDVDIEDGIFQALEHLKAQHYRNPALLLCREEKDGLPLFNSCKRRIAGFRKHAPEGKVFFVPNFMKEPEKVREAYAAFVREEVEKFSIDCVIAQNDYVASFLMRELFRNGKRVPQDFGVIGWDNLFIGECMNVTLTTFHYDRKEMAENILNVLLDQIRNGDKAGNRKLCLRLTMTVRESTQRNEWN
ncbi:MAG: LacI family DNA-binding transcriptional regulator [Lentisphaeria bacterium]|nr:LacI family DNA-binding transcriptional regulator [Lentisphaeria bacterium]